LIVLSMVLAVIVVGGGAMVASSSAAQRVIVCPLARGVPIPCCGPPVNGPREPPPGDVQPIVCCPGNALCVARPTIGSSPNPSKSTEKVVISGKMVLGAAGTAIELWQRVPGQSDFKEMAHTSTDSSGSYSITLGAGRVRTNREWYVTAGTMRSTTISQEVQSVVTLRVSSAGRRSVTLTGSVSPSHARERVVIERRSGGAWTGVARSLLNRRSRYKLELRLARNRASVVRAVLAADAKNILSASAPLTLAGRT
jgi:hypothetical protein